jgi:hypothetical protein
LRQRPRRIPSLDGSPSNVSLLLGLCIITMILSLVLGGGTRSGFLPDAILQLAAIPLLLVAMWRLWETPLTKSAKLPLRFCLAIVLLPLVQLVPLPPGLWTSLPGRGPFVESFELIGRKLPWSPISVTPRATWLAALSMLVPISVFLGVVLLNNRERRLLSLAVLAAGVVSVFLGLSQIAQGPGSALRFFNVTNPFDAVGFFANRNHFAALLYAMTLFAAAWAVDAAATIGSDARGKRTETALIAALAGSFTILVAFVAAQAMARSRAGLALTIIALFGAFALGFPGRRNSSGASAQKVLAGAVALAAVLALQFALYRILERFTADQLADIRIVFARNTVEAARAFMPFGSGMGSFVTVYGLVDCRGEISHHGGDPSSGR